MISDVAKPTYQDTYEQIWTVVYDCQKQLEFRSDVITFI